MFCISRTMPMSFAAEDTLHAVIRSGKVKSSLIYRIRKLHLNSFLIIQWVYKEFNNPDLLLVGVVSRIGLIKIDYIVMWILKDATSRGRSGNRVSESQARPTQCTCACCLPHFTYRERSAVQLARDYSASDLYTPSNKKCDSDHVHYWHTGIMVIFRF